jgi:predicted nucleic acid-binding Zn ribbon protein
MYGREKEECVVCGSIMAKSQKLMGEESKELMSKVVAEGMTRRVSSKLGCIKKRVELE